MITFRDLSGDYVHSPLARVDTIHPTRQLCEAFMSAQWLSCLVLNCCFTVRFWGWKGGVSGCLYQAKLNWINFLFKSKVLFRLWVQSLYIYQKSQSSQVKLNYPCTGWLHGSSAVIIKGNWGRNSRGEAKKIVSYTIFLGNRLTVPTVPTIG